MTDADLTDVIKIMARTAGIEAQLRALYSRFPKQDFLNTAAFALRGVWLYSEEEIANLVEKVRVEG